MRVRVLDVMQTLLDLRALDPKFESIFRDRTVRQQWFQQMLQSAFVSIATDAYRDFGQIGRAALQMTAQRHGMELSAAQQQRILGAVRQPDARALCIKRSAGAIARPRGFSGVLRRRRLRGPGVFLRNGCTARPSLASLAQGPANRRRSTHLRAPRLREAAAPGGPT